MSIDWRRGLRRKIAWLLIAKVAALAFLWALFFSPEHRIKVTPMRADRVLGINPTATGNGQVLEFKGEGEQ